MDKVVSSLYQKVCICVLLWITMCMRYLQLLSRLPSYHRLWWLFENVKYNGIKIKNTVWITCVAVVLFYAMVDISISHSSSKSCRSLVLKLGWLSHIDSITNPSLLLLQLCKPCVDISDDFDWYSDLYISIKCFARSTRQAKQSEMKVCWWRSIRWTLHLRKFSSEQVA